MFLCIFFHLTALSVWQSFLTQGSCGRTWSDPQPAATRSFRAFVRWGSADAPSQRHRRDSAWPEQSPLGRHPQRMMTDASGFISLIMFHRRRNFLVSSTAKFHYHLHSLTAPLGTTKRTLRKDTRDTNPSMQKPCVTTP